MLQKQVWQVRSAMRRRAFDAAFNSRYWARDRRRLIVLGDSHVLPVRRYVVPRVDAWIDVVGVGGATAQGLVNPNSATNALGKFQARLDRARPGVTLVFELGEVDCGFVIWYRAEKHGMSVSEQLDVSLDNYLGFVDRQRAAGFPVWVLSAPPPTILDGQEWGEVANQRRSVTATLVQRTELTHEYNARLRAACDERGVVFLDVTSQHVDPATNLVRDVHRHPDPLNHHLDDEPWGEAILEAFVEASGNGSTPLIRRRS